MQNMFEQSALTKTGAFPGTQHLPNEDRAQYGINAKGASSGSLMWQAFNAECIRREFVKEYIEQCCRASNAGTDLDPVVSEVRRLQSLIQQDR